MRDLREGRSILHGPNAAVDAHLFLIRIRSIANTPKFGRTAAGASWHYGHKHFTFGFSFLFFFLSFYGVFSRILAWCFSSAYSKSPRRQGPLGDDEKEHSIKLGVEGNVMIDSDCLGTVHFSFHVIASTRPIPQWHQGALGSRCSG